MSHRDAVPAPSSVADAIEASVIALTRAGLTMRRADDVLYDGRHVVIEGKPMLNFGGCSYLGLELRDELRRGVMEATDRYGTQFSFSRAYVESPLYAELESELDAITGGYALVTPSTTLGHIAAIPSLVRPHDAVLVDQFAHASVQTAVSLLRGVTLRTLRHNRIDLLERMLTELAPRHERVWYLLDGVYSMHGDVASFGALRALLDRFPALHLYIDDAHGTSWAGRQGRGLALDALGGHPRVTVALSLNKAFAASGGTVVFPSPEWRLRVRRCGGPMLFSGPIQPPMLGAALASAWLHRTEEFPSLQDALATRIRAVAEGASGIPLHNAHRTPIFFVTCGPEATSFALARAMHEAGFYVSVSTFPAVVHNRSGVRFTLSLHNTMDDIGALLETLGSLCRQLGVRPTDAEPAAARTSGVVAVASDDGRFDEEEGPASAHEA